jgi:asparagine synthase (glutamine-hydrolysing)
MLKEISQVVEEPLATTSIVPMYFLSELASKHVKVVLSGQGADESLGGYPRYQGEIISQKIPRRLIYYANKLVNALGIKNERFLRAAGSLCETDDVKRFLKIYTVFSDEEILKLIGIVETKSYQNIKYYYDLLNCRKKRESVDRMMAVDVRLNLADDLLLYTDKVTMKFSLECRVPLLDLELMNFIESLPSDYKLKVGKTKIIHKAFALRTLPGEIVKRKKKGFKSPTQIWFKENMDEIEKLLLDKNHKFAQIFDLSEVEKILNQHEHGYNKEKQIFLLLSIYFWVS